MNGRALVLMFVLLAVVAAGCRSRKTQTPQAAPPVPDAPVVTQPSVRVSPPSEDFRPAEPQTAEADVLTSDLQELNRQARERGWIRDAFFPFDASTLDADAQEALRQSAAWLRSHAEYRVRIEGHCDERGTEQYNLALGERRAETAASYLATLGIDRSRIATVSYGEERPFEEGSSEARWAQNRRAHLVLERAP